MAWQDEDGLWRKDKPSNGSKYLYVRQMSDGRFRGSLRHSGKQLFFGPYWAESKVARAVAAEIDRHTEAVVMDQEPANKTMGGTD